MEKSFWKSKKFWAAIIGALIPILQQFGIEIPTESIYPIMAYLVGQGIADHGKVGVKQLAKSAEYVNLSPDDLPGFQGHEIGKK